MKRKPVRNRIVVILVVFWGMLFPLTTVSVSFAEEKVCMSGGLGYFIPTDSDVKDKYGSGFTPSVCLRYDISPSWYIAGDFGYWRGSKDETMYDAKVENSLRTIPLTLTGIYNFPVQGKLLPYVGGGLSVYFAEKKASGSYMDPMKHEVVISESDSKTTLGFHGVVGVDYFVSPRFAFNLQTKYSYAPVENWDMNIGGLQISAGVKFYAGKQEWGWRELNQSEYRIDQRSGYALLWVQNVSDLADGKYWVTAYVYNDSNNNGRQDPNEPIIEAKKKLRIEKGNSITGLKIAGFGELHEVIKVGISIPPK